MSDFQKMDKKFLTTQQYRDASNLNARGALHARFSTNPYPWFRWLFDELLALAPANARILEIGCGPAGLWAENLDRLPAGWRVTLTDLSDGMVTAARERLRSALSKVFTIQQADAENLPFADASFDVIIANHMLYHVPDRPKALQEFRRVLKPGGALLAATNGQTNMAEINGIIREASPETPAMSDIFAAANETFKLENGGAQLAPYFAPLETHEYLDGLRVTDEAALVAYVNSIDIPAMRTPEFQATLTKVVHGRMQAGAGVITITKSVGVFIGRRSQES